MGQGDLPLRILAEGRSEVMKDHPCMRGFVSDTLPPSCLRGKDAAIQQNWFQLQAMVKTQQSRKTRNTRGDSLCRITYFLKIISWKEFWKLTSQAGIFSEVLPTYTQLCQLVALAASKWLKEMTLATWKHGVASPLWVSRALRVRDVAGAAQHTTSHQDADFQWSAEPKVGEDTLADVSNACSVMISLKSIYCFCLSGQEVLRAPFCMYLLMVFKGSCKPQEPFPRKLSGLSAPSPGPIATVFIYYLIYFGVQVLSSAGDQTQMCCVHKASPLFSVLWIWAY